MRKVLLSTVLTAAAVLSVSCQKETSVPAGPEPSEEITFTARIDDEFTRTTLVGGGKVNWNYGDYITVNGVSFKGTPKSDPTGADFVMDDLQKAAPQSPFYAFFPKDIQIEENYGEFPDVQVYAEGRFDNIPMYAYSKNDTVLNFKNICGVLAVKVGPGDIDQVAGIRVSSTDEAMSGEFYIDENGSAVLTEDAKSALGTVVLTCYEPVTIDADKVFYVAVPAQTYTDINIELSSDGVTYTKGMLTTNKNDIAVKCGEIYSIGFKADAATANCYISEKTSKYWKIKAVRGCSSELVGCVDTVKVLWESNGTSTAPSANSMISEVSYNGRGWIEYQTTTSLGNAVIAACDSKGRVLWSWHIWLTDQPKEQEYNNHTGVMMDRNLGATDTVSIAADNASALGLFYQWGRKDPYRGFCNKIGEGFISTTNEDMWTVVNGPRTSDYANENPMSFIIGEKGWSMSPDAVWNSEKTEYDPCPVGWRVPDLWHDAATGDGPAYDSTRIGYDFGGVGGYFTQGSECWFPANDCINEDGTLSHDGTACCQWSCTKVSFLLLNWAYGMTAYRSYNKKTRTTEDIFDMEVQCSRAMGQAVRCQKIVE